MSKNTTPGARRVVPRSRGALSGVALIVLGAWGALIPFIGPYFDFSFTPDDAWHWTAARGWLEVLPGAAAVVAGTLLLVSRSRTMTLLAAWLGIAAGTWFAVGPQLQDVWHTGSPGQPAGTGAGVRALEVLALFTLLGVVIVYVAATAFGRLSVVSLRDAHAAERREAAAPADPADERPDHRTDDRTDDRTLERDGERVARSHDHRALGAHTAANDRDQQPYVQPQTSGQQGHQQPDYQQQPHPQQQYAPQAGTGQPAPGTAPGTAPAGRPGGPDARHESRTHRLFHRR